MNPLATAALHRGELQPSWHVLADHGASYTVRMPLETWLRLPAHPRRRDARKQAKNIIDFARAAGGAQAERLRWVSAADVGGEIFKVDGHARAFLWASHELAAPAEVFATVYRCQSRDDLNALYSSFDAPDSAETMYDRVCGAYHEHGLVLQSKRLRYGTIVDALHIAVHGVGRAGDASQLDVYAAVGLFKDELQTLDKVDPQPEIFVTGLVAAGLLGLATEPRSYEFFSRLSALQGSKRDGLNDPIETILVKAREIQKANSTRQRVMHVELCGAALVALERWLEGPEALGFWGLELPEASRLMERVVDQVNVMRACKGIASEPSV